VLTAELFENLLALAVEETLRRMEEAEGLAPGGELAILNQGPVVQRFGSVGDGEQAPFEVNAPNVLAPAPHTLGAHVQEGSGDDDVFPGEFLLLVGGGICSRMAGLGKFAERQEGFGGGSMPGLLAALLADDETVERTEEVIAEATSPALGIGVQIVPQNLLVDEAVDEVFGFREGQPVSGAGVGD
jgi:hypothetical protein